MLGSDVLKRTDGLDVHETSDGYIIYAVGADAVHHLSPSAALVYELSDGSRTLAETAALVGAAFGLETAPIDDVYAIAAVFVAQRVLYV